MQIQLKQGRETAYFFQAIGGILITRRGSQQSSSGEHSFMLCGRNCHSGIAFDEIDMNALSLCSGFPYIISHKGAVCLWKGKGATPEEIGVARLVGFEISGGEVKEYAEGEESDGFFDAIGGFEERSSADYWHLRPSCKKYAARLFRIDLHSLAKVCFLSLGDGHYADVAAIDRWLRCHRFARTTWTREEFISRMRSLSSTCIPPPYSYPSSLSRS